MEIGSPELKANDHKHPEKKKTRGIKMLKGFRPILTLDLRSIALLRIGIAIVVLIDLFLRLRDLEAHYTNSGVLPLQALFEYGWNSYYFSFYTIGNSFFIQLLLFLINIMAASCLLVGYRTRLFTFVCWVLIVSLHNRNPLIQQAGDDLLRLLLFWGLFLPWGYYYSLDALKNADDSNRPTRYFSLAGLAYIIQIFAVYFFSAMLKSSPEWTSDFTALYYALSLDQILMPVGQLIYPYEGLLKALTAGTYYIELLLPFVLFVPFYTSWLRALFIVVISCLHVGIALSLNVGLFPLISIVAMAGLIPGPVINFLHKKLKKGKHYAQILAASTPLRGGKLSPPKENLIKTALVAFFMAYTLAWNIRTTGVEVPDMGLNWIGNFLRVDQRWSMFAPAVFKDDGWFVLNATTQKGNKIDLLKEGEDVNFDRPDYIAGTYKNDRWRKYAENILFVYNSHYRLYYCNYMMDQWNKNNQEKIKRLEVIYMLVPSLPDYQEAGPTKEELCYCTR